MLTAVVKIAFIGYGAISQAAHRHVRSLAGDKVKVTAILVRDKSKLAGHESAALMTSSLDVLLASEPQMVIECAGHEAVDRYAMPCLAAGKDVMVVSVGALAKAQRYEALLAAAQASGRQIVLPAGAMGGVDWLAAAKYAGLKQVSLRTRKPPAAWKGTAAESMLDLDNLNHAAPVFQGNARDAALSFPQNANVAATIALAGVGFEQTQVQLWADPLASRNEHQLEVDSAMGRMQITLMGYTDPANPKTSMSTAFSVVRAVMNRASAIVI